jgi:hypothetical protein
VEAILCGELVIETIIAELRREIDRLPTVGLCRSMVAKSAASREIGVGICILTASSEKSVPSLEA